MVGASACRGAEQEGSDSAWTAVLCKCLYGGALAVLVKAHTCPMTLLFYVPIATAHRPQQRRKAVVLASCSLPSRCQPQLLILLSSVTVLCCLALPCAALLCVTHGRLCTSHMAACAAAETLSLLISCCGVALLLAAPPAGAAPPGIALNVWSY